MSKAGLIDSPRRGWFVISEKGRTLLAQAPGRIDNSVLRGYPGFQEFLRGAAIGGDGTVVGDEGLASSAEPAATTTPEEQIETAYLALQSALRDELLHRILRNSPDFYEQVIVDLLVAMGYGGSHRDAATQLGRSGDGGIDGIIDEDRLGLDRVYIQAKRYAGGTIGRPDVQAFVGSLVGHGATKGVFVTTSGFTKAAKDYVQHLSQRVVLIGGQHLADLMIEHNVGVRVSRAVEFKRVDEDFFTEDE
jgi:restriction system protein